VLPILAMLKHTMGFYKFKLSNAPWIGDDGVTVISCEVAPPPSSASRGPGAGGENSGSVG